jgi:hypothetical protein
VALVVLRYHIMYIYNYLRPSPSNDSLAEWSKAPDLGSGPKGRGFKSHSCHNSFFLYLFFPPQLVPLATSPW